MRLKGKIALVTGAASGIGRAVAVLFAKEGANIVVADVSERGNETVQAIKDLGKQAVFVRTDVSKEADAKNAVTTTVNTYGKLNVLFNNAGVFTPLRELKDMPENEWNRAIDINLKGVFLVSKHAIPEMMKTGGGSIINMASIYGHVGSVGAANYCASKAGVVLLTKVMALECATYGIRANCICPAAIVTPLHARALGGTVKDEEAIAKKGSSFIPKTGELFIGSEMEKGHIRRHPLGRFGGPIEVANVALFLASDESTYVTGTSVFVDGGYTAI